MKGERKEASQDLHGLTLNVSPFSGSGVKLMVEASGPGRSPSGGGRTVPTGRAWGWGSGSAVPFPTHFSWPGIRQAQSREAPGDRRGAAPGAAQDAPGSRTYSCAARSAPDSGPRGQPSGARPRPGLPRLARLAGHTAALRPRTGTARPVSPGPTPQLAGPAARAPRGPGEIRSPQKRRDSPGNDSSPPPSPPRCLHSLSPRVAPA